MTPQQAVMRGCSNCDEKQNDVVIYALTSQEEVKIFMNDYFGSHQRLLTSRDLP